MDIYIVIGDHFMNRYSSFPSEPSEDIEITAV